MRVTQIQLVSEYPNFYQISESNQEFVREVSKIIPRIRETQLAVWMRLLGYDKSEIFSGSLSDLKGYLTDPLEDTYRAYHGITTTTCRPIENTHTFDEMVQMKRMGKQLGLLLGDRNDYAFRSFLEATSSALLGRESKCRAIPVYLVHDEHGLYLEYLASELIGAQIGVIEKILFDSNMPALYRAILTYVLLIGAHPFEDGNGRVARLTFNAVLAQAGLGSYIPLREVFSLSTGSLSIQTRRALLQNKWDSVVKGFCEGILVTWRVNDIVARWSEEDVTSLPQKMGFHPQPTPVPQMTSKMSEGSLQG